MALNRLNSTSDKYFLQQIANNTAITGNADVQKLPPTNKQDTLQSVGIYGNDGTKWQSLKVSADGTLAVDLSIDESTLATEAKQDTMISRLQAIEDETQANGISLSSIETDTEIIKNTQATLLSTNQQILVDTTTIVATQDDILNELVGIGESTGNITKGVDATLTEAQQVLTYGRNTSSNNCKALEIDNAGNLKTTLQSVNGQVVMKTNDLTLNAKITVGEDDTLLEAQQTLIYGRKDESPTGLRAVKVLNNGSLSINDATLNAKVSKGEDATIASGAGGLQQVLMYGMDNQGNLDVLNVDNNGHLKITINNVNETNTGLKIAGETVGGDQVNLRTETNGSLNVALTSGQITGFSTSALQTTANASLTSIDSTLTDGIQIKGKFGASSVDLQANSNSQLLVDVIGSSGNGGDDLYTNATISSANTASSDISILKDRVISIMGSTTTSTAKIGLAFVDHNSDYWPSPEFADLYYDGTKYTFCMTVSNVLTDNVKVYFQTPANNVNVSYFTY